MAVLVSGTQRYLYRGWSDSAFTVAFWVYPTGGGGNFRVAFMHDYAAYAPNIASNTDNTKWELGDGYGDNVGTEAYTENTWQHVAWTRTGTSHVLYVNGISSWSGTWTTYFGPNIFFFSNSLSYYMLGRIAYAKIWTAVLSQAEVQAEMYSIRPKRTENLYGFYPFFIGSSERVRDYSGNGNSLTENSTIEDGDSPPISWGASPLVIPKGASTTAVKANKLSYLDGYGQILVPTSDVTGGLWQNEASGSTLYTSLADSNDGTYAWYQTAKVNDYFEVALGDPVNPDTGTHVIVWKVYRKAGTQSVTLKLELRQGTTVIASDSRVLTDTHQEFSKVLTAGEVSSITDYSDLRARVIIEAIS